MSRAYRPEISEVERDHLQQLLAADEPFAYRAAMQRLGADLGRRVALEVPAQGACLVVCTQCPATSQGLRWLGRPGFDLG